MLSNGGTGSTGFSISSGDAATPIPMFPLESFVFSVTTPQSCIVGLGGMRGNTGHSFQTICTLQCGQVNCNGKNSILTASGMREAVRHSSQIKAQPLL